MYTYRSLTTNSIATVLFQADEYAKGMLALGLKPGQSDLAVVGCGSNTAVTLFVACCSIGIAYTVSE